MLTGKCKELFESWFLVKDLADFMNGDNGEPEETMKVFYALPPLFQQGVYFAFFREKGIGIYFYSHNRTIPEKLSKVYSFYVQAVNTKETYWDDITDFNTGFITAISHANDLVNAF